MAVYFKLVRMRMPPEQIKRKMSVEGFEPSANGQACIQMCPANAVRVGNDQCACQANFEPIAGRCVPACPQNAERDANGNCACMAGFMVQNGACINPCPENAYFDGKGCLCKVCVLFESQNVTRVCTCSEVLTVTGILHRNVPGGL